MATDTSLATGAGHQPSGRRTVRKQRTVNPLVNPLMVPARYNSCSSFQAALRAAACNGRNEVLVMIGISNGFAAAIR